MDYYSMPVLFFTTIFLLLSDCAAVDTISANQAIKDGETIVSHGEMYELGFFSPGNTKKRYLGIWYKKISTGTVVWVANRETPINDTSGVFKFCQDGNLVILSGGNTVIWTSNSTASISVGSNNFVAQLLDTGNLVVWDRSRNSTNQNVVWESFDYPGDTLLPGMKFGNDMVTGLQRCMTSWKSPDDPSGGLYNHILDTNGYPQIFGRQGSVLLSRLGPWTGVRFSGFATELPNPVFSAEFVNNQKEIYHKYELVSSVVERRVLTWDGKIKILRWIDRKQEWVVYADTGGDSSCPFELCGSYGVCSTKKHPPCSCMQGFEPKFPQEWKASDWSSGCQRKKPLDSGNRNGFQKYSGVKLPDTRFSWYSHSMTLGECEMTCRMNFSCTAYASLDIRNGGSGGLLWFKELMDVREYDEDHNIYIRMVASDLEGYHQSDSKKWKGVLTMVLSILSAAIVLCAVAYGCRKRKERLQMKKKGFESLNCGYISPEYAVHGRFSIKSDVFSFGVLMLEMVSGKRNREFSHKDHSDNLLDCAAVDTISANQAIKDGETIVSHGEMYELGFFSPGNTKKRYLGIWYKKISTGTVVWVANRETPINDTSGVFKFCQDGNLVILSGGNTVIWTSNSTASISVGSNNFVAQLLDTGNLVVWDRSRNSTNQNVVWESFDYPGDTLLPGMKFGNDMVTGLQRCMTSWKSPDDPSGGLYNHILDTNGYPQIFGRQGSVLLSRLGPWTGVRFSGFATELPNPVFSAEFVNNQKEIYHKYELEWVVYADTGGDSSCPFELCGSYGVCSTKKHPPCSCMQGFEPKFPQEWKASDWSSGCQRKKPLDSGNRNGFQKYSGVKLPDTRFSWYSHSMTLGECEMTCRMNFSCTAYASLDIRNGGSGCLLWFKELMDVREYDEDHNIYIRMVASDLEGYHQSDSKKWKGVLTMVLSILSAAIVLCAVAYGCRKRKERLQMKKKEDLEYALDKKRTSVQMQLLDDTPFISLYKVAKATNNFSVSNKIGEGGFGPVYKGVFEDGQEVAVKRLSDTSQQGTDEFKNELISISKLQHRNLVKLLGYCIHGNEMILIYEYMANKSLDSFIFDETRSSMLDWPQRFKIILGMARGILYLHQDSRFQIIHRDLKAGNILLDSDMNPKISDFGLARKFVGHDITAKTKKVVGTYGYISPEYAVHGRFSIKSDVFSFGVLVLEMVSGKRNREFSHKDHSDNLLGHAWRLYKDEKSIELMGACLRASSVVREVLRSIHVGLLCVQHHAKDRPTMLSVLLMLLSECVLPEPKQPAFFTDESYRELDYISSLDENMITLLHPR
ncbi:hypothetical protein L1987_11461 [Smallanthus sonchifolius]|uniref:Uncharacterized protein n=1 Tax=Smallanthus sonchifolius TaxID=185202 RepID=A0ACB9JBK5_9ASTR|nr:hypothetical protein L1987_11461 [Smallanthus sonchifolius]